jgi:hypothetical protein
MRMGDLINRVLLILGSYSFTVPVVSLIHEIGHIMAMYSVGITRYTLVINPFTESYATPWVSLPAEHLLYISISGMVLQTVVFAFVGWALWRSRSVFMLPLMMCLPMSLINVGSYLLMGSVVDGSDVMLMVGAGVPSIMIQWSGIILLVLGLWAFTRILPVAGFRKTDSMLDVFLPVFLGTGIYSLAMLVYGYLSGYGTMIGAINIVFSLINGVIYALMLKKNLQYIEANNPSTLDSYKVLGVGLTAVILCFLIF